MNEKVWCLLSGGKDSVCTAAFLAEQGRLAGCVFIDTGISCPDTCPFVQRLCKSQGWELRIFKAKKEYEDLVMRFGFPQGPVGHKWAYIWLKERALREAKKALGPDVTFASGVRKKESNRRARSIATGMKGGIRIEAPIQDWSTSDVWRFIRERGLEVSPSYLSLGRSGDCLCGSFSQRGEADVIRRAYPDVAARILSLEERVKESFPYPRNRWGHAERSMGGFTALRGRRTLEQIVCGGDCANGD